MRAVDTNVVVRYLAGDGSGQSARARALIDGGEVWLLLAVILETEWVLRSSYRFSPAEIIATFRTLAGQPTVSIENPAALADALHLFEAGLDFADALHLCATPDGVGFATFDRALIKRAVVLGLAQVEAA
jgi:predicted nucleic-acid-binding protein